MNTSSIPQELTNIPFGQIFILTNPGQGITSTTIQKIQAVISLAGSLGQKGIVYALPVDVLGLWDCFICKVKKEEGVQILVSDKDSLIEMLCEFWGLDYEEVSKTIDIAKRYKGKVTLGGENHPVRIPVTPVRKPEKEETEDYSTLLQCITDHTKEGELAKIEKALEEAFTHHIDITGIDLLTLLDKVSHKERKTYQLDIKIEKGKENEGKNGVWDSRRTCDIKLIDSAGKEHSIKLEAQLKALYLTFILFRDGIKLSDLKTSDEFYNLFKHICERLRSINNIPDKEGLEKEVRGKRNKIKKLISEATTGDIEAMEQFGIEGYTGDVFKVNGATDEHRDYIKEMFGIE